VLYYSLLTRLCVRKGTFGLHKNETILSAEIFEFSQIGCFLSWVMQFVSKKQLKLCNEINKDNWTLL